MSSDEVTKTLLARLKDCEDGYTERKSQGVSSEDICKTLVAFANSLTEDQEGFLFIGIEDKTGDVSGRQHKQNFHLTYNALSANIH